MSDQLESLRGKCDRCSQKLEFPVDAVGTEAQCPTCGMTTRLYSERSIPIPPPIRPSRTGDSADKPTERIAASMPPRPSAPVAVRKGKSLERSIVAAVVLLGIGIPCINVWQKRAQEIAQVKTELRLLEAQIQTGMNYNDFLAQVAHIRAARLAARETLSESQETEFRHLDACFDLCALIWNPQQPGNQSSGPDWFVNYGDLVLHEKLNTLFVEFGIEGNLKWFDQAEHNFGYNTHDCTAAMLSRTTEDIEAFLKGQPSPWPK